MSKISADSISSRSGGSISFNNTVTGTAATITNITGTAATITDITGTNITGTNITGTATTFGSININSSTLQTKGVVETVAAATTFMSGSNMVLELDVRQSTVYTYTIPTGRNIGIVSFKNVPADQQNGLTVTVISTQNAAGTGNTTNATGIGTNITIVPYSNGASLTPITGKNDFVGSGTTITLSLTGNDRDFVSFFVHYNGGTNTSGSSYDIYATKNGNFR